jgi:alpha-tubulin suppressor-like RCC1 family protein
MFMLMIRQTFTFQLSKVHHAPRRHFNSQQGSRSSQWIRPAIIFVGAFATVSTVYMYAGLKPDVGKRAVTEDVTPETPETKSNLSKDETRDLLSSQHVQVKKGLECPGVYLWGSNVNRVADPDSAQTVVKTPRRVGYFDGMLLRDLKVDQSSGAAITENGDLVQWGKGFSETEFTPMRTLTGKDLVAMCISRDRIIALSSRGSVYSLPVTKDAQSTGFKQREASWIPLRSSPSPISYRQLRPPVGLGEKVAFISGGLEHVLMLTSSGRVFSAAAATENYPSKGQLGIPGLTWATRPEGPADTCYEIKSLREHKIVQMASGDYHSLLLDKDGRVFVFGDNSFGQLGFEFDAASPFSSVPTLLPLRKLYPGNGWFPRATAVAAGGSTSFLAVDVQRTAVPRNERPTSKNLSPITTDTWSFGKGIFGILGNGKWTHLQDIPTKVKALSGLYEYDDKTQKVNPIRLRQIAVGFTHAAAVLANNTHMNISGNSDRTPVSDTSWGQDVLLWGGNGFYQLGTGKRNNISVPTYINPPSDVMDGDKEARFQIIPRHRRTVGNRNFTFEQRIECGRNVSALYSAV